MNKYFLSPIAEQDIDEIVSYLAQENPKAAMKLLDAFSVMYKIIRNVHTNEHYHHRKMINALSHKF